jgi:hypothetical protein
MNTITTKCVNGNLHEGDLVISTPGDDYACLIGRVTKINLLGTPEHNEKTDNETDDVHVNFLEFNYPKKRNREIEDEFCGLYSTKKDFADCGLDDVIMSPCCLLRITGIAENELDYLLQSGYNAACYCYGILSGLTDKIELANNPLEISLTSNEMAMLNHANSGFKITRIINGRTTDIELTCHELYDAFVLREHRFQVEDIEGILAEMEDDNNLGSHTADQVRANPALMGKIMSAYVKNRDDYGMEWSEAALDAIKKNITNTEDL